MAQLIGLVLYSSWYKSMAGEHKVCMISNVTSAKTCQQTLEKLYSPSASIPPVSREWKYRPTLQSDYKNSWDNMYCLSTWNILYKNVLLLFQLASFFQIYLDNLFKTEESISNYLLTCCTIGPNLKIVGAKVMGTPFSPIMSSYGFGIHFGGKKHDSLCQYHDKCLKGSNLFLFITYFPYQFKNFQ